MDETRSETGDTSRLQILIDGGHRILFLISPLIGLWPPKEPLHKLGESRQHVQR
jgi:hypothetical protein